MEYEHDHEHPSSAPKQPSKLGPARDWTGTGQLAEDRGLTPAEEEQQRATRLYHMRHMLHEARQRAAARAAAAKDGAAPDSAATEQAAREQAAREQAAAAAVPSMDLLRQFNAARRDAAEGHGSPLGAAPASPAAAPAPRHAPSPREERPALAVGEQAVAEAARAEREHAGAPPAPDGVHGADARAAAALALQPAPYGAATPSGLAPLVIPSTSRQIEALRARGAGVPLDPALARMMAGGLGVDAADLAPIRLHNDPGAWALAARFGQPVYAEGNDVFFQKGAYQPGRPQGRNLLGRQLARTPAVLAAQRLRAAATYPALPAQAPAAAPHAPVGAAPHVPRGGDDRSTLVNELTRLAEQPGSGYALFTVLLGSDPLTGRAVPRPDDATLTTEIVRFVPNGATYLPVLRANGGLTQFVATMTDHAHLAYFVTPGLASGLVHAVAAFLANPESWWEQALDHTPWHSLTQAADEFFQRLFTTYLMAVRDVARNAGPAVFGAIGAAAQGALTAVGHVAGVVGHAAGAVVRMVATFASGPVAVVERATGQWVVVVNGVVSPLEQAALAQAENAIKDVIGLQLTPLTLPVTLGRIAWEHLPAPLAKTLVAECIGVCLRSIDLVGALAEGGLEFLGVIVEHGVIGFVRGLTALPPLQAVAILTRVAALLAQPQGAFAKGLLRGVGEGLRDNVLGLADLVKGVLTLAGDIERSFGGLVRMLGDPTIARDLHTAATALQGELTGVAPLLVSSQGLDEARQVAEAIKGAVEPKIADLAETAGAQVARGLIAQLSGSDEHLGEVVGRIGGSVVFNVALSALTDGAFTVGRAALTALVDAARIATQGAHAGLLVAALQQWLPLLVSGLKVALTGLKGALGQALERIVATLEPVLQRLAALAGRAGDTNPAGKTMTALGAALGHGARDALLVDLTPNQVEGLLARLGSDGPTLLKQMLEADRLTPLEIERLAGPGGGLDPQDLRDLLGRLGAGTVKTLLTALSPTEIKDLVGALGPAAVTRLLATLTAAEIKAFLDTFGLDIATKFLGDLTAGEVRELSGLSDPRAVAQFKAAALRSKNVTGLRSYLAGMRAKGKGSLQAGLIADAERAPKAPTPAHPSGPAVASFSFPGHIQV